MTFDSEIEAFRTFARDFPTRAVLLIDTYDVEEGARRAAKVAEELRPGRREARRRAHRLRRPRRAGPRWCARSSTRRAATTCPSFLSGDLDEFRIAELVADGAPADAFGVGTQLGTSADAPALGGVYKLVADEHGPKMKTSTGKVSVPGRKQIYRCAEDRYVEDIVALIDEHLTERSSTAREGDDRRRAQPARGALGCDARPVQGRPRPAPATPPIAGALAAPPIRSPCRRLWARWLLRPAARLTK